MKMLISKIIPETTEIKSLKLVPSDGNWGTVFPFVPGQIVSLSLPELKPAYFAIASAPEERGYLDILVKQGKGTSGAIFGLKVGSEIEVSNPTGKGFPVD